jgi:hypothetical protein
MYNLGESVFAYWRSTGLFHLGTVVDTNSSGYHVVFEDGDQAESLADSDLKPADLFVGKKVLAMWTDRSLYPGTIAKVCGRAFFIHFDDGDRAWVSMMGIALKQ